MPIAARRRANQGSTSLFFPCPWCRQENLLCTPRHSTAEGVTYVEGYCPRCGLVCEFAVFYRRVRDGDPELYNPFTTDEVSEHGRSTPRKRGGTPPAEGFHGR